LRSFFRNKQKIAQLAPKRSKGSLGEQHGIALVERGLYQEKIIPGERSVSMNKAVTKPDKVITFSLKE